MNRYLQETKMLNYHHSSIKLLIEENQWTADDNFQNPQVDWNINDTYIQKKGINNDFGVFYSPDEFFEKYQQRLSPLKK